MFGPTEVDSSMMGKNDIVGNQTALMHKKDPTQHTHEKPQWMGEQDAKFQAKDDSTCC